MSFFKWISPIDAIVKTVGGIIDDLHLSGEEKLEAQQKLIKLEQDYQIARQQIENEFQQELTKRHQADMASDNQLSKNIRPYTLLFLLGITTVLAITDGNINFTLAEVDYAFTIKKEWVELYTLMASSAVIFYFGGRSWEKRAAIQKKDNE